MAACNEKRDAQTPADEDAARLWKKIGMPESRISRHGAKDNFWQMGDTGPCGPCSEIHFDRGDVKGTFGGDDPVGDRVLEIWNCVFMQYERLADRSLIALPAPSVDTGMGLERLAMVMGGHASNYDTDLLRPLVAFSEEKLGKKYGSSDDSNDVAMRVIADHARTTAFLVADGVLPGNVNREYVLRSIMRRAVRFGDRLGFKDLFFHDAVDRAVEMMGGAYPELRAARALLQKVVQNEEEAFRRTLQKGLERFQNEVVKCGAVLSGAVVHDLKATYGFPPDLTAQLLREVGLHYDEKGYEKAEAAHAAASSTDHVGVEGTASIWKALRQEFDVTLFAGYQQNTLAGCRVLALVKEGAQVQRLEAGDNGVVLLHQTPFYGESGGQVGDRGMLSVHALQKDGKNVVAKVNDTKRQVDLHLHVVTIQSGSLAVGDVVEAAVDGTLLARTRRNHSATHLLHWALRQVLGEHVVQKGSLVDPQRLRFDFAHFESLTDGQIAQVEDLVNGLVLDNVDAVEKQLSLEQARSSGAVALFGEKYGDSVRVMAFGPSVELCGGIHVKRTGDIGGFKITSDGALAAGVRRIEAVTGMGAVEHTRKQAALLSQLARGLRTSVDELPTRFDKLQEQLKATQQELEKHKQQASAASAAASAASAVDIAGTKLLVLRADGTDPKGLRDYADKLRDQLQSGVVVLGLVDGDKVTLLVAITADVAKAGKLHAGKIIGELATLVGGKGGGKPELAQAGGNLPDKLNDALAHAQLLVQRALTG